MTDKKTIEQELQEATGVKAKKDRSAYLTALHAAVMKLPDEGWDKLSDGAQKWANAGTKAIEASVTIADFATPKAAPAADEAKEAPVTAKQTPKKPAAKPAKAAETDEPDAPAPKAKAVAKEKPAPKPKVVGKVEKLKGLILKNMKAKPEDLKAKVLAAGLEISDATITTVRSDFLGTVRVLQKAGKLSEDLIDLD